MTIPVEPLVKVRNIEFALCTLYSPIHTHKLCFCDNDILFVWNIYTFTYLYPKFQLGVQMIKQKVGFFVCFQLMSTHVNSKTHFQIQRQWSPYFETLYEKIFSRLILAFGYLVRLVDNQKVGNVLYFSHQCFY